MKAGQNSLDNQAKSDVPAAKTFINDDLSDLITKNSFAALNDDMTWSELGFEDNSSQGDKGVHELDSDSDNEVDEYIEFGKLLNTLPLTLFKFLRSLFIFFNLLAKINIRNP